MEIVEYKQVPFGNFQGLEGIANFNIAGTIVPFKLLYLCDLSIYAKSLAGARFARVHKPYHSGFSFVLRSFDELNFTQIPYWNDSYRTYIRDGRDRTTTFYKCAYVPPVNPKSLPHNHFYSQTVPTFAAPVFPTLEMTIQSVNTGNTTNGVAFSAVAENIPDTMHNFNPYHIISANKPPQNFTSMYFSDVVDELKAWCYNSKAEIFKQNQYWLSREKDRIKMSEDENFSRYLERKSEGENVQTMIERFQQRLDVL